MTRLFQPRILGVLIPSLFILGSGLMGYLLDNYSFFSQTLSEIGSLSSPMKIPYQILKILVAILILILSIILFNFSRREKLSVIPTLFLFSFGLSDMGLALFPTPHSLHNVFGLSLILGYLSPIFFAVLWSKRISANFSFVSIGFFALIALGIFLNLSPIFKPDLYPLNYYGLVQRFLVFTMLIYMAYLGSTVQNRY